jgi:hypothetical protein
MIAETFRSKRPAPTKYWPTIYPAQSPQQVATHKNYSAHEIHQAEARGITPMEYVRRNNIIKDLSDKVRFKPGDTCYPETKAGYGKYGACMIVGICRSYKDFAFDAEWPENDFPMIITFTPLNDRKSHIHCTWNYLVAKNPHIATC